MLKEIKVLVETEDNAVISGIVVAAGPKPFVPTEIPAFNGQKILAVAKELGQMVLT